MDDKPNIERLVRNPHYKMSSKQLEEIETKQTTEYYQRKLDTNVRHDVSVKKHDPSMQEEERNDRPATKRARPYRSSLSVRENRQTNG